MLENEIKELNKECADSKAQALSLPPYYLAPEWATGSNAFAVNTPRDEPSSQEEEFPLETAAVEPRAMRKGISNGAEPASTLHRHTAHIKERRRTSAGTKTVCSFCNTGAKLRSDRCPLKAAIGNNIKVDNQHALVSVTVKLGMQPEQQDLPIVAWMQQNQDITKAYILCMQNCTVRKEFYSENTKVNLMKMGDILYGFGTLGNGS